MADLNTGLSAPEVLEAFDRALHDYTNSQIDTMLAAKQTTLTFDSIPTDGSTNPVRSDGIYDFVNSSVATNTANFIGTFNSVAELEAYSGTVTNNDYAFVISTDSAGNTVYNRYKYNGSAWGFEYALNNSSFTAAQWATIQSGLTASDKTKLDGIEAGANKIVVDANLSQTSTNPVQNKVVNDALATKQDTIADLSEIRSGAAAGATAVQQTAFETDQQRQETEIGVVANAGAKNNADFTFGGVIQNVNVKPGTIVCVEDNGTFIFSGASADKNYAAYILKQFLLKAGTYKITGVSGGSNTTYWMRVGTGTTDTGLFNFYDGEREFTLDSDTLITVQIVIYANQTVSNLIFKPMIRRAEITDDTFVPYAKTNRELTVAEAEGRAALVEQVDEGAKNLLRITASSQVVGGVTFTVNADGTIIANGTKTNNDWLYLSTGNSLAAGTYVLSSGLTPQSDMNLRLLITTADSLGSAIMSAEGTRQTHIKQLTSDYTGLYYAIRISSGTTVNNVVFKPMLCTAADWAVSQKFVPYCPTNRELYEMIQALQNGA